MVRNRHIFLFILFVAAFYLNNYSRAGRKLAFSSERVIFQLFIRVVHPFDNEIPDITFLYALKLFFRSCFKNYIMYILYFHIIAIVFVICDMFFFFFKSCFIILGIFCRKSDIIFNKI